ncbi:hypothetical protein HG826_08080 [Streptomyces sp. GMY01]|uniref:hypothetical protein n=1 Tax=Streptomyces sp. GMY02 TaxID=1333528 RepID=UPI00146D11CA|nr:hypothetical protein [Streptomyces sp. GMY02]NMO33546.1 hypothetical protein [Streptomyces sp. GMY02]
MIVVESYAMIRPREFIQFEPMQDIATEIDLIEGAVEIAIGDCVLVDTRLWDYLYPLWAYLADSVSTLRATGAGSFRFPDQPIQVEFERAPKGGLQVTVSGDGETRRAIANESEFLQALRSRGSDFFSKLSNGFPVERALIERNWKKLLRDPVDSLLADAPWEERVGEVQSSAFRQAERVVGRCMNAVQREQLISDVAGRRLSFGELVSRAERELCGAQPGRS